MAKRITKEQIAALYGVPVELLENYTSYYEEYERINKGTSQAIVQAIMKDEASDKNER